MAKKSMKELVAYAKKRAKEKHKYVRSGKKSWAVGFDCHWFTSHVYKDCGYTDVYNRISKSGTPHFYKKPYDKTRLGVYKVIHRASGLKQSELLPGDIVCKPLSFTTGYHSAIYVGDGRVAETTSNSGSRIGRLTSKYVYAFRIPDGSSDKKETVKKETAKKEPAKKETIKKEPVKKETTKKETTTKSSAKKKTETVKHEAKYKVLAKEGMNVRKSYSTSSKRIGGISYGKIFSVTKKHGNWVYSSSKKGWVCIKGSKETYLKKV